eukprot:jgi/Tetstr1/427279/TSEL_001732.t1
MPSGREEWMGGDGSAAAAAAGSALLSVGAASLRLMAGTLSAGYNTISAAAASGGAGSGEAKEKVLWARFDRLELTRGRPPREVLLLGYASGFQLWDVHEPQAVRELLSLRDTPVRHVQPLPTPLEADPESSPLHGHRPLLALVPGEVEPADDSSGIDGRLNGKGGKGAVELFSLRSRALVHTFNFSSRVVGVQASARALLIGLEAQLYVYDTNTLSTLFSGMTYPLPASLASIHGSHAWAAPVALGARWLAYASNQSVQQPVGCASNVAVAAGAPRGARNGSAGYKDYMRSVAKQAASSSGKQLKAGLNYLGESGYKLLSNQYSQWVGRRGGEPGEPEGGGAALGRSPEHGFGDHMQAQVAGTVVVRDLVRRSTIAHFRAHTSPLSLLAWDPSGMLLVTTSVYGHSVNVWHVCPPRPGEQATSGGASSNVSHLYKLSRGLTPALITSAAFSLNSDWLAVSSARATTHIFHLGGAGGPGAPLGPGGVHLAALAKRGPAGAGELPRLVQHLSAVGRLRSTSSWTARVPGAQMATAAAGAAAGLYAGGPGTAGPSAGAISAMFVLTPRSASEGSSLSSSMAYEDAAAGGAEADEELLIAGPDGMLTRYRLGVGAEGGQVGEDDAVMFGTSPASAGSSMSGVDDGELLAEVCARLDVCRRPSWPEHGDLGPALAEPPVPRAAAPVPGGPFQRTGVSEEERHAFIAQAELQTTARAPLWVASPQLHFLEMQPHSGKRPKGGLLYVEELPTRRVDLSRGEPLPTRPAWAPADLGEPPAPPAGPSRGSSASSSQRALRAEAVDDVEGCIAQVEAFEF